MKAWKPSIGDIIHVHEDYSHGFHLNNNGSFWIGLGTRMVVLGSNRVRNWIKLDLLAEGHVGSMSYEETSLWAHGKVCKVLSVK